MDVHIIANDSPDLPRTTRIASSLSFRSLFCCGILSGSQLCVAWGINAGSTTTHQLVLDFRLHHRTIVETHPPTSFSASLEEFVARHNPLHLNADQVRCLVSNDVVWANIVIAGL